MDFLLQYTVTKNINDFLPSEKQDFTFAFLFQNNDLLRQQKSVVTPKRPKIEEVTKLPPAKKPKSKALRDFSIESYDPKKSMTGPEYIYPNYFEVLCRYFPDAKTRTMEYVLFYKKRILNSRYLKERRDLIAEKEWSLARTNPSYMRAIQSYIEEDFSFTVDIPDVDVLGKINQYIIKMKETNNFFEIDQLIDMISNLIPDIPTDNNAQKNMVYANIIATRSEKLKLKLESKFPNINLAQTPWFILAPIKDDVIQYVKKFSYQQYQDLIEFF